MEVHKMAFVKGAVSSLPMMGESVMVHKFHSALGCVKNMANPEGVMKYGDSGSLDEKKTLAS